jgi:hypothetical protein
VTKDSALPKEKTMTTSPCLPTDYEDMAAYFALQSEKVRQNAQIVDAVMLNQSFMLHIDKNPIPIFIPMMPRSAMPSEDNTIARVTVTPSLMGCYVGYYRAHNDFIKGTGTKPGEKDAYRGGYVIHRLDFTHCLVPNDKLVPDAPRSAEHWLVPYNKASLEYPSVEVGKMFITEVLQKASAKGKPSTQLTIFIECTMDEGFLFTPHVKVAEGLHKARVLWERGVRDTCFLDHNVVVQAIDQAAWSAAKQLSADLLSYREPTALKSPRYTAWR